MCTVGERGGQQHAQKHWPGQLRNAPDSIRFRSMRIPRRAITINFGMESVILLSRCRFFEAVAESQHRRLAPAVSKAELSESLTSITAQNKLAVRRALEAAGIEFIDENGSGPGVHENTLRRRSMCFRPTAYPTGGTASSGPSAFKDISKLCPRGPGARAHTTALGASCAMLRPGTPWGGGDGIHPYVF